MKLPDAGGIAASSRWLSAATPPDTRPRITCTPEGCQRIHILALPNHGAWDTSEPKPPIRRFIPNSHFQIFADLTAHVDSLAPLRGAYFSEYQRSGGVATLNHRLQAWIPPGSHYGRRGPVMGQTGVVQKGSNAKYNDWTGGSLSAHPAPPHSLSLRAPAVAPFRPVLTKLPDAGGIAASSRWLSVATPPDTRPRITCTLEGCQRIHILTLPNHGAWGTSEPKPPIRRFITNSHFQIFADLTAHVDSLAPLRGAYFSEYQRSGGVATLNHRLQAWIPPGSHYGRRGPVMGQTGVVQKGSNAKYNDWTGGSLSAHPAPPHSLSLRAPAVAPFRPVLTKFPRCRRHRSE